MSGAVHTPLMVDYLATSSGIAIRNGRGSIVAVCKHHPFEDMIGSEAERFARLFAAAPELLEALEDVLGWHDDADNLHKPIEVRAAYMRARAAIAKVKGEQA